MSEVIHYSGGLRLKHGRYGMKKILPGYPACLTGRSAERVRAEGRQTSIIDDVTCMRCMAMIERSRREREPCPAQGEEG